VAHFGTIARILYRFGCSVVDVVSYLSFCQSGKEEGVSLVDFWAGLESFEGSTADLYHPFLILPHIHSKLQIIAPKR
jgi:hypothetical protein